MDFQHSERTQQYIKKVKTFIDDKIRPIEASHFHELHQRNHGADWKKWTVSPIIDNLKQQAKDWTSWALNLEAYKMDNIKNIIFDLGGVIMDIDVKHTLKAFSGLGIKNIDN